MSECIGRDPLCPCQDGDVCHYVDNYNSVTGFTKAMPIPRQIPRHCPKYDIPCARDCEGDECLLEMEGA